MSEPITAPWRNDTTFVMPGQEISAELQAAVSTDERFVPGAAGDPDVRVLVHRRRDAVGARPLVLTIHGGAFCFLSADSTAGVDAAMAFDLDCVVVAVDYRLAPEHRFPAAPDDCYAALTWAANQPDIDARRTVVSGASAGGALAAAVALMARDRGGPAIALQALLMPMLDDRLLGPSVAQFRDASTVPPPGFNGQQAVDAWANYLGQDADRASTSAYAAPARAADVAGLPPAFIRVNGRDPLRDEGLEYASRLLAAGVPVELYSASDLVHGIPPDGHRQAIHSKLLLDAAIREAIAS
jgi:acetyl esterase